MRDYERGPVKVKLENNWSHFWWPLIFMVVIAAVVGVAVLLYNVVT